jgi:hypothetical protein
MKNAFSVLTLVFGCAMTAAHAGAQEQFDPA